MKTPSVTYIKATPTQRERMIALVMKYAALGQAVLDAEAKAEKPKAS